MEQNSLLCFVKDETQKELEKLVADIDYTDLCCDEEGSYTLSKMTLSLRAIRKVVGKGKNQKTKLFLDRDIIVHKFELASWCDDIECKDLDSLKDLFESEKCEAEFRAEQIKKGIVFDGQRYWRKFDYKNGKVYFKRGFVVFDENGEAM